MLLPQGKEALVKLAMKESYPHTSTWPYVMSVLLLLGLVLAPPVRWPLAVREIYEFASQSSQSPSEKAIEDSSGRLVIAFDPAAQKQAEQPQPGSQPGTRRPQPKTSYANALTDVVPQEAISPSFTESDDLPRRITPSPATADVYVWQPPPNWNPEPIKPLDTFASTTAPIIDLQTDSMGTECNEPTLALPKPAVIQPPVANRVVVPVEVFEIDIAESGSPTNMGSPEDVDSQSGSLDTEIAKVDLPAAIEPEGDITVPSNDSTVTTQSVPDAWPKSPVIDKLLTAAHNDIVLKNWANEISEALQSVQGSRVAGTLDQIAIVARLRELASMKVDRSRWPDVHRTLHDRIRYAILRRVDVWEPLLGIANREPSSLAIYRSSKQLAVEAKWLEDNFATSSTTKPWIEYLGLQQLQTPSSNPQESRALADAVLSRMRSTRISEEQRRYLSSSNFQRFESQIRNLIAKSVHPSEVMQAIEKYEAAPNRTTSNDLILLIQRWRSAPNNEMYKRTIDLIVAHYRNANLRVAVSEDLINRFVPAVRQYGDSVNEQILGAAVTGRSSTQSNVSVKLIPDNDAIHLGLLAAGNVQSNTSSRKGPVTMYNRTQSSFAAGKEFVLRSDGMFTFPTETRANSGNQLLGMQTDWDDIPLIGRFIRSVAQQEIIEQRAQVRAETQMRVRQQAKERIDKEIDKRMTAAGKNLDLNVVGPLRRLELDPKAMELRTTGERVIVRTRLASPWQFAAHSPRPQIRADSKMSLHIHQSAANNIIEQLQLQNRRMTLEELIASLSERFDMPLQLASDEHKDAIIEFAEHPLEFDFNDGRVQLTMHFAELSTGRRKWKDFSIRGYYRADVRELVVELEREDGIELIGERIGLRDQIALRGIFAKVLGKHRRLQILQNAIQQQPQLQSLTVTQFTIRDGWLALAFGEDPSQRVTEQSNSTAR